MFEVSSPLRLMDPLDPSTVGHRSDEGNDPINVTQSSGE